VKLATKDWVAEVRSETLEESVNWVTKIWAVLNESYAEAISLIAAAKVAIELTESSALAASEMRGVCPCVAETNSLPVVASIKYALKTLADVSVVSVALADSDTETLHTSPSSELNGVDDMGAKPSIYYVGPAGAPLGGGI